MRAKAVELAGARLGVPAFGARGEPTAADIKALIQNNTVALGDAGQFALVSVHSPQPRDRAVGGASYLKEYALDVYLVTALDVDGWESALDRHDDLVDAAVFEVFDAASVTAYVGDLRNYFYQFSDAGAIEIEKALTESLLIDRVRKIAIPKR